MNEGKLVPDELMINLVLSEATPEMESGKSLLLDGFPRTIAQAKALDQSVEVDLVVNLNVPNETIVRRISDRYEAFFCFFLFAIYIILTIKIDGFTSNPEESIATLTNHQRSMEKTIRRESRWCSEKMTNRIE